MAVKASGSLSFQTDIVGEFLGTAPHSLSEYYDAATGIPASGAISFSDFYSKSRFIGPSDYSSYFTGSTVGSCPSSGQTWTAPAGTTTVYVLAIGSGGGGNNNGNHSGSDAFGSYSAGPYPGTGGGGIAVKISNVAEGDVFTINPGCGGLNGFDSQNVGGFPTTVTASLASGTSVSLSALGGYGHGDTTHTDRRAANTGSTSTTGATTVIATGTNTDGSFGDYRQTYDVISAFQSAVSPFSTGAAIDSAIANMLSGVTRNTRNTASTNLDNWNIGSGASSSNPLPGYAGAGNVRGANGAAIIYWTEE